MLMKHNNDTNRRHIPNGHAFLQIPFEQGIRLKFKII